ncbi:MAG: alpha/beta hydrolase [Alphaproteobacteria bacterium]|nr:alpha/beta hydrolase [Alphaproteobacteria bacterium]
MLRLLIAFLIAYMGLVATMTVRQRSFMYFPLTTARPDITKAPWMSWVDTTTKDGLDLKSWFSEPQDGMPTLIFFHGNGHNIESRGPKILPFVDKGYGVLLAEYRGYGGNPGNPSEKGFYHDARAQIDWLADKHGIKGDDLIMYGESIGSGVAVQMATEYETHALILDAPFSSALDIAHFEFFFVPFLSKIMKDKYLNHKKIGSIHTPVLIGIGGRDTIIPPRFGKKLFAEANEPKVLKVYDKAVHMGIYEYGFAEDAIDFISALEPKEAAAKPYSSSP